MRLAQLARGTHGVVTRRELLNVGVSRSEIEHRVGSGALIAVFRGVYRVGHRAPSFEADYLAAVRACGPSALLSGRAAAYLFGLLKGPPPPPEVTVPTYRCVIGVRTRRARRRGTLWRGVPVTSVEDTIIDLAAELQPDDLARAWHEAGIRYYARPEQVDAALARRPRTTGAGKLRRVLHGDTHVTLSRLESLFIALLRRHNLPLPQTNRPAGSMRVDCRWPQHNLTVELDSYRYHNSRHAWDQGHRRERESYARGDGFRRYTWSDVSEAPAQMLAELTELLAPPPPAARGRAHS